MRDQGLLEIGKVSQAHDLPAECEITLADGSTLRGKLCVAAIGVSKGLTKSLSTSSAKSGIHIARFLDCLTQKKDPYYHALTDDCSENDLFALLAIELLFGKLLNI